MKYFLGVVLSFFLSCAVAQSPTLAVFSTLAAATSATVDPGVDIVHLLGQNTAGDNGEASYIRVTSSAAPWGFQSADHQWWTLNEHTITPEMFQCFSLVVDCTGPLASMATWLTSSGGGKIVSFNSLADYKIWPVGTHPATAMLISNVSGITFKFNGGRISSDNAFGFGDNPQIIDLHHVSDIIFENPSYTATAWSGALNPHDFGSFIRVFDDLGAPWSDNVHITNLSQNGGSISFSVIADPTINSQAHNFSVINADIKNVFYGLNFQASGDNFFARNIKGTNNGRLYFPISVSHHDVELTGDGSAGGFVQVLMSVFGHPKANEVRRSLSDIHVKYRDSGGNTAPGSVSMIAAEQAVPQPVVSGAANNGSGLVRLTVDTTANMATDQIWFVNGVGGITGVNGNKWKLTVIDGTHVDLQTSTFSGGYTSGGYMRVPVTIKNVTVDLDITGSPTAAQSPAFAIGKYNSDLSDDLTTDGYTVENVTLRGSIRNYNNGPAISMFTNDGISHGTWVGEDIDNISLRNLRLSGSNSSVNIDATNIKNLLLENVVSPSTIPWTVAMVGGGENIKAINVVASGLAGLGAWTPYTPVTSCASGSFGAGTVASGEYKKVEKTVHVRAQIYPVFNGTCAGSMRISTPITASPLFYPITASDMLTGSLASALIGNGDGTTIRIFSPSGGYPIGLSPAVIGEYQVP